MNKTKRNNVKITALLLAMMLLVGGVIGGTVAWLVATTAPVVNTFTVGNITLELKETFNTENDSTHAGYDAWIGKLVPGQTLSKDPVVTVKAGSEGCWVFVEIEEYCGVEAYTFKDFVDYSVALKPDDANGWTLVEGKTNVYYRQVSANDADQPFPVLVGNEVTVKQTVTKEIIDKVTTENAPKLTFKAYAIQSENLTYPSEANEEAEKAAKAEAERALRERLKAELLEEMRKEAAAGKVEEV